MTEYSQAQKSLDALYEELPTLECKGLCQESCGPIDMTKWENSRIRRRLGVKRLPGPDPATLICPMLSGGKCRVYRVRPMICRLWGIVETMACPHGCEPERWLTHGEGKIFLLRAEIISAESDGQRKLLRESIAWIKAHPEEMEKRAREYEEQLDALEAELRREAEALGHTTGEAA